MASDEQGLSLLADAVTVYAVLRPRIEVVGESTDPRAVAVALCKLAAEHLRGAGFDRSAAMFTFENAFAASYGPNGDDLAPSGVAIDTTAEPTTEPPPASSPAAAPEQGAEVIELGEADDERDAS